MPSKPLLLDPPLIAILRGITPDAALGVGVALDEAGIRCVETPLNSPDALKSITILRQRFDGRMQIGAGTVLSPADVEASANAGAEFIVSPNTDAKVVEATKRRGLWSLPGFFTPSDALVALEAGADGLKLFPADVASPAYVRALRAVLPKARIFPTGGVTVENMSAYLDAGAAGFGIGTSFYRPGDSPDVVRERASAFVRAYRALGRTA